MNDSTFLFPEKWKIILALAIVVACSLLDKIIPPFGIPIALIAIFLLFRWKKLPISLLGFFRPKSWIRIFLIGLFVAVLIQVFEAFVLTPVTAWFGIEKDVLSLYTTLEGNNSMFILYLIISWTTAGFGEEIIYRGFFLGQCVSLFRNNQNKWIISLVISSVIFGFGHFNNGTYAIIATAINGFIIGLVYLKTGRNIWAAFFTHALANTIELLISYSGLYKHLF